MGFIKGFKSNRKVFISGLKVGMPVCLGYFAVSFALGIAAENAGLNAFQGFIMSMLNNASAGEYAAITVIRENGAYIEMALVTLVANARYLLMSCALSQRMSPETGSLHRILIGFDITDELFGIAISQSGDINPYYTYGAMTVSIAGWSTGTALGVIAGNVLPDVIVNALSVALYGMFIAIVIPPAKKDRIIALLVAVSFLLSFAFSAVPIISGISETLRVVILTVSLSAVAALIFPRKENQDE